MPLVLTIKSRVYELFELKKFKNLIIATKAFNEIEKLS
jgi:hypothetical protein